MWRYLRLYLYFVRFSVSKAFEFRFDYFFRVFMDLLYYLVNLALYKVLFLHTPVLAGWREDQALVFVAMYLTVDALQMTFVSSNMWWLPITVNTGGLDYYLVRPVSSLFFLNFREFSANSFLNLVIALGILGYGIYGLEDGFGLSQALLLGVLLINGTVLYWLTHLVFLLPVFWTQSGRGLGVLFYTFARLMERPDRIYFGPVRVVLTTVLPFALMASVPARLVLEGPEPRLLVLMAGTTLGMGCMVGVLWRMALRGYASASS